MPYYAVRVGRCRGVFSTWSECEQMVKGYSGAQYKKFSTLEDAKQFTEGVKSDGPVIALNNSRARRFPFATADDSQPPKKYSRRSSNSRDKGAGKENPGVPSEDTDTLDSPIVYTDGACIGPSDNRQAGYGVYWGPGHQLNVSERLAGEQTNNRAEIEAVITAVKQAKEAGIPSIIIATDSKFAKKCATEWGPVWERNGWKLYDGKPVKLKEPVERLLQITRNSGIKVSWRYVPGHSGVEGNEAADRLANIGAKKPIQNK